MSLSEETSQSEPLDSSSSSSSSPMEEAVWIFRKKVQRDKKYQRIIRRHHSMRLGPVYIGILVLLAVSISLVVITSGRIFMGVYSQTSIKDKIMDMANQNIAVSFDLLKKNLDKIAVDRVFLNQYIDQLRRRRLNSSVEALLLKLSERPIGGQMWRIRLSQFYLSLNKTEEAGWQIKHVLLMNPKNQIALKLQALYLIQKKEYRGAVRALKFILLSNELNPAANLLLRETYLRLGDQEHADNYEFNLLKARKKDFKEEFMPEIRARLIRFYADHKKIEISQVLLDNSHLSPEPVVLISARAYLVYRQGHYEDSRKIVDELLTLPQPTTRIFLLSSKIAVAQSDFPVAIRDGLAALRRSPNNPEANRLVGDLYYEHFAQDHVEDYGAASRLYRKVRSMSPPNASLNYRILLCEYYLKNYKKAFWELDALEKMKPGLPRFLQIRADLFLRSGFPRQSIPFYQKFQKQAGLKEKIKVDNNIGVAQELIGQYRVARVYYWKAMKAAFVPSDADPIAQKNLNRSLKKMKPRPLEQYIHYKLPRDLF